MVLQERLEVHAVLRRGADPNWRHECFMRCNIYLDNCLGQGTWTDKASRF